MDAHDKRMNPRPGQCEPGASGSEEASAGAERGPSGTDPGRDPAGSGPGQVAEPGFVRDPAGSTPGQDLAEHTGSSGSGTDEDPAGPGSPEHPDDAQRPAAEADAHRASGAPETAPDAASAGIAGLSFRYQVAAAVALAAIGVAACFHLALVFLSVAPSNTMTKQHGQVVDDWVLPEFEQNWKLFAPNPLQQNIAVEARAEVRTASGGIETTGWYNISALDGAAIDSNPVPSHTQQNELRRAWDFFVSTHDNQNRSSSMRGTLSEGYLRRIIVLRLHRLGVGEVPVPAQSGGNAAADGTGKDKIVERVQIRSMTTNVQPPVWSGTGPYSDKPFYRTLSWWTVTSDDMPFDAAAPARPKDTTTEAKAR